MSRSISYLALIKETAKEWSDDKASRLGAALAYYSVFSLGPLLIIVIAVAGLVFGQDAVHGEISRQLSDTIGSTGAAAIEGLLAGASQFKAGTFATLLGVATLILAALGVVIQLKDALNTIWNVEKKPGKGVWGFVRDYVISLAAILAIGFLLMLSLVVSAAISIVGNYLAGYLPIPAIVLQSLNFVVSLGVITLLFAMMFKWLPDTEVRWRDVWIGAALTAILFNVGKSLIGLYIGRQSLSSTYGAAASLVVLLLWIYYSAQIVFFGAEFTQVYARRHGSRSLPGTSLERRAAPGRIARDPGLGGHPTPT